MTTKTIRKTITDQDRVIVTLSLKIAEEQFKKDAEIARPGFPNLAARFDEQGKQARALLALFESAETITLDFDPNTGDR